MAAHSLSTKLVHAKSVAVAVAEAAGGGAADSVVGAAVAAGSAAVVVADAVDSAEAAVVETAATAAIATGTNLTGLLSTHLKTKTSAYGGGFCFSIGSIIA